MNAVAEFVSSLHVDNHLRTVCPNCSKDRKKSHLKELNIDRKEDALVY
jgi:hypothetical protein